MPRPPSDDSCRRPSGSSSTWRRCRRSSFPATSPTSPSTGDDDSFRQATFYGSIFPPVWNFQLALHTRGYGTCITTLHLLREPEVQALLGIPDTYVQSCLLPVARLRAGTHFQPAPRRPIEEVVALDGWDGPPL